MIKALIVLIVVVLLAVAGFVVFVIDDARDHDTALRLHVQHEVERGALRAA